MLFRSVRQQSGGAGDSNDVWEAEDLRGLSIRAWRRGVLPCPELRGHSTEAGHGRVGRTGECLRC